MLIIDGVEFRLFYFRLLILVYFQTLCYFTVYVFFCKNFFWQLMEKSKLGKN